MDWLDLIFRYLILLEIIFFLSLQLNGTFLRWPNRVVTWSLPITVSAVFLMLSDTVRGALSIQSESLQLIGGFLGVYLGAVLAEYIARSQRARVANVLLFHLFEELRGNSDTLKGIAETLKPHIESGLTDNLSAKRLMKKLATLKDSYCLFGLKQDHYLAYLSGGHPGNLLLPTKYIWHIKEDATLTDSVINDVRIAYDKVSHLLNSINTNHAGMELMEETAKDPSITPDQGAEMFLDRVRGNFQNILEANEGAYMYSLKAQESIRKYLKKTALKVVTEE